MPNPIQTRKVIKTLEKNGFVFVSQNGSHAKYCKTESTTLVVIVPIHGNEILYGTFRSIMRQSKLNEEDFRN
jgi:predicted RNA binding protein YcfA (HicA-like mRNA interferase family)